MSRGCSWSSSTSTALPRCLTGWLGESGYLERSLVYLRDLDPVRTHYADMRRVKEHVTLNRFNESIRAFLATHDDPPLSQDDLVTRPSWSPIARPENTAPAPPADLSA